MNQHGQIPTATYRLQFSREFTFRDAAALVPYLAALGVSHCYASPYLRARPGSTHGYDIIDHNALNPEIGSPEDYEHFVAELHRHGMGQILDVVPNHMGVMGSDNFWWLDVLENGEASEHADFFDIDWDPIKDELQGKVLIPILADQYGYVLERGELKLAFDIERGEFSIFYHQHRFPVDPAEYPQILSFRLETLREALGSDHEDLLELQSIATAFSHLPGRRNATPEQRAGRSREKEVQKRRLAALCGRSAETRDFVLSNVEALNGNPDDIRSFDALHELIKSQAYRLAHWRVAADDINYRRFVDINDLAALCAESDRVFDSTHHYILELVAQGKINGLRIDHPDGLFDPTKYLVQLRSEAAAARPGDKTAAGSTYIVVEKILTGRERLREEWPVHGTTGYEFANLVNGLFVDPDAAARMERIYRLYSGHDVPFSDLVYTCKKLILKVALASELNVLANALSRIALANRHSCDFTMNSLRSALAEIIACFPVYRTYIRGGNVSDEDRGYLEAAVSEGRKRSTAADLSVFDFIHRILLLETNGSQSERYKQAITRFAMKFQQVTAAAMAKGMEDTAFYRYHRLVSLNEVGGDPRRFGTTVREFHACNEQRLSSWPHSMLASSTHDSKRSEDVRARINVLSEIPGAWRLRLRRWRDWNRSKKRTVDGRFAPTRNDEYLLYQTLVGTWPVEPLDKESWRVFSERIEQYMLKAVREAKEHTSWANTNTEYEGALIGFVRAVLEPRSQNHFLADFMEFERQIIRLGVLNSLSQTLLKLTSPGVPDIYQGTELWQFNLVDPDNRRPVDYGLRQEALQSLQRESTLVNERARYAHELLSNVDDGSIKLFLTWKTLELRRAEAALFQEGDYVPLKVAGKRGEHVCAFARRYQARTAIVAVPRLCGTLLPEDGNLCDESIWAETQIEIPGTSAACYHNVFTGECVPAGGDKEHQVLQVTDVFRNFPAGLFVNGPSER